MTTKSSATAKEKAWSSGKLIEAKPPLQAKQVWAIRDHLELASNTGDLALFNLATEKAAV